MTKNEIDLFETLQGQLDSFHREMNTLVKKNPNDLLNKFKLDLINSLLKRANTVLGKTRKPFQDFDQFDESTLPFTSDVLVIISQYLAALEQLRTENIEYGRGKWCWIGQNDRERYERNTYPPKQLDR